MNHLQVKIINVLCLFWSKGLYPEKTDFMKSTKEKKKKEKMLEEEEEKEDDEEWLPSSKKKRPRPPRNYFSF